MAFDFNDYKVIKSLKYEVNPFVGYAYDAQGIKYDCDSCPEVWEKVHKVMHKDSKLKEIFGSFDNNDLDNNKGIFRKLALEPKNDNSFVRYAIGGDTDFNMQFKTKDKFNHYVEKHKINDKVKEEIEQMYRHKYCYENFSLMLTTGGTGSLNLIKNRCYMFARGDNLCKFIYKLDKEFYCGKKTESDHIFDNVKIKNASNEQIKQAKHIMWKYLKSFGSIKDYCKEIYKINEDLVNRILDFVKHEYDYKDDYNAGISDYIEIVKEMWECKKKFLEENK